MKMKRFILPILWVLAIFTILGIAYEYFKSSLPSFILVYDNYIRLFLLLCCILCILAIIVDHISYLIRRSRFYASGLPQIDHMDGHDFEVYSAYLLRQNGFSNVQVTQASGDFGVDIIAHRNGLSYAVQCKRYSHHVGVKAVQEAVSGRLYYHCDQAVVLTNNYYTAPAKELANCTAVKLWDRRYLNAMIQNAKKNTKSASRKSRPTQTMQPAQPSPILSAPQEQTSLLEEELIQNILLETQNELSADIALTDEYVENILRDSIQELQ